MVIETLKVSSVTKNVISVDAATGEGKGIAHHLAKAVINAVVRTTLEQFADPVVDQVAMDLSQDVTQEGECQMRPKENAHTDLMCMKLKNVMMTWGT